MAHEFHAVHPRHLKVANDDIDRRISRCEDIECGFSVASFTDAGHTERPEHTDERLALKIVILGDQEMKFSHLHVELRPPATRPAAVTGERDRPVPQVHGSEACSEFVVSSEAAALPQTTLSSTENVAEASFLPIH